MGQYNSYNVNIYKQVTWLLHRGIRKSKWLILAKAMCFPLIYVLNSFFNYRAAKIYQLMITPQVCYLQRMLNDAYDFTPRRIVIHDATWHLPWFLYTENELKPEYLFTESENNPVFLYTDGESGEALNDFVVLVPGSINFSDAEMRSKIDSYKLFGTTYTIQRT